MPQPIEQDIVDELRKTNGLLKEMLKEMQMQNEALRLRPSGPYIVDSSKLLCAICGADVSKGETCCLARHAHHDNPSGGAIGIYCSCPRCSPQCGTDYRK